MTEKLLIQQDADVAKLRKRVKAEFSNRLAHVDSAELEVLLNRTGTPALEPDAQIEQSNGHSRHEPIYVRCPVPAQVAASMERKY